MTDLAAAIEKADKEPTVLDLVKQSRDQFELALAGTIDADKFTRVALTAIRTNKDLQKASVPSLLGSLMVCAQLGLEPTGPLGHAYLVPFKNNQSKTTEVQLIVGYKGMIELAYRSGRVARIVARVVHEGDEFDYAYGLEDTLHHVPGPGGALTHVYAIGKIVGGDPVSVVLTKAEVDKTKGKYGRAKSSPWNTDYEAMAMKTAVRRLFTWLPSSAIPQPALQADGGVVTGVPESVEDFDDVIDIEADEE